MMDFKIAKVSSAKLRITSSLKVANMQEVHYWLDAFLYSFIKTQEKIKRMFKRFSIQLVLSHCSVLNPVLAQNCTISDFSQEDYVKSKLQWFSLWYPSHLLNWLMAQNILGILNKFLTFWLILHDSRKTTATKRLSKYATTVHSG